MKKYKKDGHAPHIVFAYNSIDGEEGEIGFSYRAAIEWWNGWI